MTTTMKKRPAKKQADKQPSTKRRTRSGGKGLVKQQAPDKTASDGTAILGRAMLVNLSISSWSARMRDREVTERVNSEMGADDDAGNYWKKLLGKCPEYGSVQGATTSLRNAHYMHTLPWTDKGWRLLPTANYFEYTEAIRVRRRALEDAVERLIKVYPEYVKADKDRLGKMFSESDYPTPGQVRNKFANSIDYAPLPAEGDFRVSLPTAEMEEMAASVKNRLAEAVRLAVQDVWQRLGEAVAHLREQLEPDKKLREPMLEKVKEIADALGKLNITEDASLDAMRVEVVKQLTSITADTLRGDEKKRAEVAKKADDILKRMQGLYSPASKEDK